MNKPNHAGENDTTIPEPESGSNMNGTGFRIGRILRSARKEAGMTQEEVARRLQTRKSAISRIENHAEDIRISTLQKFAEATGKRLTLRIV
jgi:ribosome-binding protein aMBF1 (putative translation factor)